MRRINKLALTILALLATLAGAGAIKSWSSGATLNSIDLNNNFAHMHNVMVGGHGARLVDADVSASANIALFKLAITAALLPKAWATFATNCGTVCAETMTASSGVTSIVNTATGTYTVTWATARTDVNYAPIVSSRTNLVYCNANGATTTTTQIVVCKTATSGADTNAIFSILLMDNT